MKQAARLSLLAGVSGKVVLHETMDDLTKWTMSSWKPETEMHPFELKTPKYAPADSKDTALATSQDARFYGASTTFPDGEAVLDKKMLLVQYEVTQDKDVECGGGYLKIGPKMEDATKFGDPTEYALMFGPDKCGHTKRTHLIFNYKGKNVLKTSDLPYKQDEEGLPTVYRLLMKPEGNKLQVKVNDEEIYSGDMESDFKLLEMKEIDDPEDKKPSDWVDDPMMDDPSETKPSDWVEEKEIVDKDAKQPEDWDAEEDGEWEAPMIPNPEYKGEWKAKRISNPDYKGVWAPKKIDNPKYEADSDLYLMNKKPLAFVGFDLWQVKAGTLFDNVIIATGDTEDEVTKEADERVTEFKNMKDKMKSEKEKATTTTTTTAAPDSSEDEDKDDDVDAEKGASKDDEDL